MTADISHELRTPLAALQAGLEELRDGLVAPDQPRLDGLHAQAQRLGRIVEDLSLLSAAQAGGVGLHPRPVDLTELATEAVGRPGPCWRRPASPPKSEAFRTYSSRRIRAGCTSASETCSRMPPGTVGQVITCG